MRGSTSSSPRCPFKVRLTRIISSPISESFSGCHELGGFRESSLNYVLLGEYYQTVPSGSSSIPGPARDELFGRLSQNRTGSQSAAPPDWRYGRSADTRPFHYSRRKYATTSP